MPPTVPSIRIALKSMKTHTYLIPVKITSTWSELQLTLRKIFPSFQSPFIIYAESGDIIHSSVWSSYVTDQALFFVEPRPKEKLRLIVDVSGPSEPVTVAVYPWGELQHMMDRFAKRLGKDPTGARLEKDGSTLHLSQTVEEAGIVSEDRLMCTWRDEL
ncbi:hypothetical protein CALCODRAFT_33984 [Calocera cornea HHB12733]|uniref:Rad60/SUMO-like domain-containing protein n=1 Tax=Calocera cornea HHB12733 TaxID=1353952 RepID=A0A165E114_9BASI|nr:hypothetical protein CALCODRAFT_33984 [Calocera cornea HHB12733]